MQGAEKLPGDAQSVSSPLAKGRRNRGTRPWREVIGEFRASGLTIQAYSERSGISRSSMARYLVLARQAERRGDTAHAASATDEVSQPIAGFMRVGIVDRAVGATGTGNSCDVPGRDDDAFDGREGVRRRRADRHAQVDRFAFDACSPDVQSGCPERTHVRLLRSAPRQDQGFGL